MTDLISFVSPSQTTTTGSAADSAATLAGNFDTFLTILTAQIQNQDPLEPLDSTQFTEQLVQFSGVEQQIQTNSSMETLINATRSNAGASLAGYLGETAEIDTAGAAFSNTPITWQYNLPRAATSATAVVSNANGEVIYSSAVSPESGAQQFIWSGETTSGETAAPGAYFINIVASDAQNESIDAAYSVLTKVTGVDLTYGEPALTTSAGIFSYADIRRLVRDEAN